MFFFKQQLKAIGLLEKAFARCDKVHLVFYGCDYSIYVMDRRMHDKAVEELEKEGLIEVGIPTIAQKVEEIGGEYFLLDTKEAYLDSGGA